MLTQWFDPEPTSKGLVFARALVNQGFEVEVVTGFPNYPGGKIYSGYSIKWLQREVIDGVKITRVPLYPSHDQTAWKRVLNYVSFAVSSLVYTLIFAKSANIIYAYHPPLTIGVGASIVRFFRRTPVVYDIQDMWPDTLLSSGMFRSARALKLVGWVCNWVYRQVTHIVVLSPGFKRLLISRGVPEEKITVIYNWADEASLEKIANPGHSIFPSTGKFHILFAGNMGRAQALDTILDAAEILQRRGSHVCWVMLGGGIEVERLKGEAIRRKLGNVKFLPPVRMAEVGAYLSAADALLVHLKKDQLFRITIPSKTQAYMKAGKPILMAVDGDAADLVLESGAGVIAESENALDVARAAEVLAGMSEQALVNMGRSAQDYYNETLSLSHGICKFEEIFRSKASN